MKLFAGLAGLAAIILSGTAAAQPVQNPGGIVPNFAPQNVVPVLQEAGFTVQQQMMDGQPVLLAEIQGRRIILRPRVCRTSTNCAGLFMVALINGTSTLSQVNAFNLNSPPTRAVLLSGSGNVALSRYLIADYGTTRGSLAINAGVFARGIDAWFQAAQGGPAEVSFSPIGESVSIDPSDIDHETAELIGRLSTEWSMMNHEFGAAEVNGAN